MDPKQIARLVELACLLEVMAPKPGNVNRRYDFVDTTFEDFVLSAWASATAFVQCESLTVGQLVLQGVQATQKVVATNTNLGILLLLAPMAKAAVISPDLDALRYELIQVLNKLTVADARDVYAAIRATKAGGLRVVPEQDVAQEPTVSLLEAMEMSQSYDSIAREYCSGFNYTFTIGFPALQQALTTYKCWSTAVVQAYLQLLAVVPDTLIARKAGAEQANMVSRQAQQVLVASDLNSEDGRHKLAFFDGYLRREGNRLNPGTTADLITAVIFAHLVLNGYEGILT